MRWLLALLGVSAMIGLAAPAHGDPDAAPDDAGFLATVRGAGITYTDSGQAVAFGKSVCGLIRAGKPGPELVGDLQRKNPGLTTAHATLFIGIAAKYYCPQQLADSRPAPQ
ncbi:glycine cleavage system P protein [Mycobacterium florentinum]|uniref:Glycine cleavage system P protein n=1 Tax=Mycobacterium florentinum TaxID=292462 RepID=A0A1X1TZU4_MYCFL|nr:DUF732 domain-containing protein [Mycobacterium florentinum]MCV7413342.1 DUF732 domain-containing protein [Mycobacterium florentinum]ORV50105.1 glycine cleavage system P protein [Mycobacterium florentinum]BBX76874.1 hypothetical protein MFLOJ_06610 [Mycobacterium florentinum]